MSEENVGWGCVQYTYNKDQAKLCYDILEANNWDLISSFEVASENQEACGDMPHGMLLRRLQELLAYKITRGRNFEAIWSAMIRDIKELYSLSETHTS